MTCEVESGRLVPGRPSWSGRRRWPNIARQRKGVAALETAVVLPVLLMVMLGIMQGGILFSNFIQLTNAVRVSARVLASSRGSATPYTNAMNAAYLAAPNLTRAQIGLTLSVAGAACSADGACATALSSNAGNNSSVAATYPCRMTFMGYNFIPGCTLGTSTTERVE